LYILRCGKGPGSGYFSLLSVRIVTYNYGVMIIAISRGKQVWGHDKDLGPGE
jgi:hypothetical protein